MSVSPTQKAIVLHLSRQTGFRSWKEMAQETRINPNTFRSALTKLEQAGYVQREEDSDSLNWVITQEGLEYAQSPLGKITMEDVGITDRQIFLQLGASIGGIPIEKLEVISNMVWSGNPYDLEWVWKELGKANVPLDTRSFWFEAWRSHLSHGGKPSDIPESIKAEVTPAEKRTTEILKQAAEEGRDYIIEDGKIVRVGSGIGQFTMKDAKEILALYALQSRPRVEAAAATDGVQKETLSSLISALTPLLNKDTNESMVKELLEEKLKNMGDSITAKIPPAQQPQTMASQLTQLATVLATLLPTLRDLGPVIRSVLGLPEVGAVAAQPAPVQPVQLQNPDGTPIVMDMPNYISIEKFRAEQRRDDEAAKGKQEFMGAVKGFVERLGKAAERAATG